MSRKPSLSPKLLNWANSQTIGGVSEIAVLAPVKKGRAAGENRTYEERLRFAIGSLAGRVNREFRLNWTRFPPSISVA